METDKTRTSPAETQEGEEARVESELREAYRRGTFFSSLPKWTAVAIIAWQAGISVRALASRDSLPSLLLARFGRQASYWEIVCWIAGLLGILFGLYSWRLLLRQAGMDTARLSTLEKRLNLVAPPSVKSPEQV